MDIEEFVDQIVDIFNKKEKTLQLNEISKALGIKSTSSKYEKLKEVLNYMMMEGILSKSVRRKYTLVKRKKSNEFVGILRIQEDRGTVTVNDPEVSKVTVKRKNMHTALDGDTVLVKLLASKKEMKFEGEITNVIQRQERTIVGNIEYDGSFFFLVPDDRQYLVDFLIPSDKMKGAEAGDKVSARFLFWNNPQKSPQAEIVEVLGQSGKPAVEFDSVMREFSLPPDFPPEVAADAKNSPKKVSKVDMEGRLDLREKEIITIDPVDARDFDDALSLEKLDNGHFVLGVHIADVSHYVKESSAIDVEAIKRANSVYLVDRVIPMLPEELSNEMCSLNPNRVRLAYSVLMEMDEDTKIHNYEIRETVIKSKKRFTYEQVQAIIDTGKGPHLELVLELHKLSEKLREKRFENGGIDFHTSEIRFKLDEDKNPIEAMLKKSIPSTQLVEECMLAANKAVAEHVKNISKTYRLKTVLPFLYRVHAEPLPEKLRDSLEFVKMLGPKHNFEIKSSKDINALIDCFKDAPEEAIVNQILVRSMPKAEYSDDNIGHYGLGFEDYAHFTSPIRRYPDLIVHRLLKEYNACKPSPNRVHFLVDQLKGVGEHCTARERLAMEAERASTKLAQTILAKKNIGKTFNGSITGVMNFGLFITMDGIYAEGLLHIKDIFDDYYIFDEKNMRIYGKKSKKVFQFGKRIRVKIYSANVDKRRIDLDYVGDAIEEEA
jgi:ribonuclease R